MAQPKKEEGLAQRLDRELEEHVAAMIEKNKDYKYTDGFKAENFLEEMEKHPAFATKAPTAEVIESSPYWQAMQAMKYECEDPHERALAYKDDGNHNFSNKDYRNAILAYNEALKIEHDDDTLKAVLYNNRAAANFYLGNNHTALDDGEAALKIKPDHMKALIRCATCCYDLEKYDDCVSWCKKGLLINEKELKLVDLKNKSVYQKKQKARDQRKSEMRGVKDLEKQNAILDALEARNIKMNDGDTKRITLERLLTNNTGPHFGKIYLDKKKVLHWPLYLLYPEYNQMDFIEDANENDTLQNHLEVVFETLPEWDVDRKYVSKNIIVLFEDKVNDKLVRLNMNLTLRKLFSDKRYNIYGGCPAVMIFSKETDFYKQFIDSQEVIEFN